MLKKPCASLNKMKKQSHTWIKWSFPLLLLVLAGYWGSLLQEAILLQYGENWERLGGFVRWLLGWLFLIGILLLICWANFRYPFRWWYAAPGEFWKYGLVHTAATWGFFELLQWRSERDPELVEENLLVTGLFSILLLGFAWVADAFRARRLHALLLREKAEAELKVLKAQIDPHFLFNTLNTIYSHTLVGNQQPAADLVHKLSGVLRFTFTQAQADWVPIADEIDFLQKFVELQKARMPEAVLSNSSFAFEWDELPCSIAPLLLIPFIENAFQYGVFPAPNSFVRLHFQVAEGVLLVELQNSVPDQQQGQRRGSGQGINNVKQRLHLLYPDRHLLRIRQEAGVSWFIYKYNCTSPHKRPPHRYDPPRHCH